MHVDGPKTPLKMIGQKRPFLTFFCQKYLSGQIFRQEFFVHTHTQTLQYPQILLKSEDFHFFAYLALHPLLLILDSLMEKKLGWPTTTCYHKIESVWTDNSHGLVSSNFYLLSVS